MTRALAGSWQKGPGSQRRQPALANNAWEALLSAHAALIREFAAEGIFSDVSMREYDVLYTLSKCPQPIRLGELNRHVLLSQPALSRLVDRLAERGLVQRTADPADRRGLHLSLTNAGEAVQREIGRQHARSVARVIGTRLTGEQIRQLEAICVRLASGPAPAHSARGAAQTVPPVAARTGTREARTGTREARTSTREESHR